MSAISGPSQSYQILTPSYSPLGKPVAGLESAENKDQTLPPVEEASASEKNRNHPNQKTDAVSADGRHGGDKKSPQAAEPIEEEEQQQLGELVAAEREALTHEAAQSNAQMPIELVLQRAAALQGDHTHIVDVHAAVDSFSATAGHTLAPGSLLDQRS